MKAAWLTLAVLLAACGKTGGTGNAAATNGIDDLGLGGPTNLQIAGRPAVPIPLPLPDPTVTPTPSTGAAPLRNTVSDAPFTDDSAQGAANVVQTYFALIEAGRYHQAWVLWREGGSGSGMNAQAFAQSFAKYGEYHAEIDAPGRIDAGAGQRYVTVPVKTYGTLKTGKPFAMAGDVTLHRTAEIDGATPEQKSWRINTVNLKPDPAEGSGQPATATARYICAGGFTFVARFDNRADAVTLTRGGRTLATLAQQRAASGVWYRGEGYALRGKGNAGTLTRPDGKALDCTTS